MKAKDDNERCYMEYNNMTSRLLRISGLWPNKKPTFFYTLRSFLALSTSFISAILVVRFVMYNLTDVALMTKGLSLATSLGTTTVKAFFFIWNRKNSLEIHNILSKYFENYINNKILKHIVLNKIKNSYRLSKIFTVFVGTSISLYVVLPVIHVVVQIMNHVEKIELIPPIPSKFPWDDTENLPLYCMDFTILVLGGTSLFSVTCGTDSLFTFYVFQMCGHLRTMSESLKNIKNDNDYYKAVRECVTKYQDLIKCRDIIQTIYGPIILWMITTNAIVICALIFQLTSLSSITVGSILVFSAYSVSKGLQTFLYAWAGSVLTSESEDFLEAIYFCNWTSSKTKPFRTSILILLSQKPIVITACSISVVSIDMFIMVLNTSISYFFLLKTMEEKQS